LSAGDLAADHGPDRCGLAETLALRTQDLHIRAERSGIVQDILRGRISRDAYALYLRNLLPAYQAMEHGLRTLRVAPGVRRIAFPALFRSDAIAHDLAALCGADWAAAMPLLPEGARYAARVADAASDGARLIGHAYTRQLGDLSGARFLARSLEKVLRLDGEAMAFFAFPDIPDQTQFKHDYRAALDLAASELTTPETVIDEALAAFECNIAVSEAVQRNALAAGGG
jgi:heme oxygenase